MRESQAEPQGESESVRHQMRDAGRVGQLQPCRSAPRSCRPSSGCSNPSAVLQCLRVRSSSASVTSSRSARLSSHSVLRLTVPLHRWRRAAARLSRLLTAPDAAPARRLAGQHTTFLVRCPRLLLSTQSAGRRPGGRRTRHRVTHPRRSPPRAELSLLARSPLTPV